MSDTEAQPFPDLRKFLDPSGIERWCSPAAVPQASSAHYINDAEGNVWMMPFMMAGKTHVVYGDPPLILVGRAVQEGFGIQPEPGWQEVVQGAGYGKAVVVGIERHLQARPPISWNVDEPAKTE